MKEMSQREYEWAHDVTERKAWLLHQPTRTLSRAKEHYFNGYRSTMDGKPVDGLVLVMEDGNAFTVPDPEIFIEVGEHDIQYFMTVQRAVNAAVQTAVEGAAAGGMRRSTVFLLTSVALRALANKVDEVSRIPEAPRG